MQPLGRPTNAWRSVAAGWLTFAALAIASSAHAGLGGAFASVQADRAHLGASMASAQTAAWSVHTLTLANRGIVKEFARSDGTVFAVAWHGPGRPDLRQLLGDRFETFQSDNASPSGRRTRRPLGVNRDDFVAHSAGHSGAFWGFAYLPKMAPAGFSTNDLR
jgi:hypothetical protein